MRFLKATIVVLLMAAVLIPASISRTVYSEEAVSTGTTDQANIAASTDATYTPGSVDLEGVAANDVTTFTFKTNEDPAGAQTQDAKSKNDDLSCRQPLTADALTGFDDLTNNFTSQTVFEKNKGLFEEPDEIGDGLGPVYNAQDCKECHQNPVTGAISQINELRAGHNVLSHGGVMFVDAPGGSLINDRGIPTPNYNGDPRKSAKVQERVPPLFTAGIIGGGPAISASRSLARCALDALAGRTNTAVCFRFPAMHILTRSVLRTS